MFCRVQEFSVSASTNSTVCVLVCTAGCLKLSLRGMTEMQPSEVIQAMPKANLFPSLGNFIKTSQGKGLLFSFILS